MSAKSCSSSSGTTSLGPDGGSAGWAWCFAPRNALFFRRRAPRLWDKMGLRRVGRGASLPATPCSSVAGHHVFGAKSDFGRLGVVLHSPQNHVLPSTGTTSLEQNRISAGWAWCFAPRNALFFRRRAPRLWSKIGFGRLGVVLRSSQCLVLSSTGTTSSEQNGASAGWAWCFAPRKTLFFRRRAPRLWDKIGLRPVGRGASLPPMPCSSVVGHHAFGAKSDSAG